MFVIYRYIQELLGAVRDRGEGVVTNFFHGEQIVGLWEKYGLLRVQKQGDTLFVAKSNPEAFDHLFFASTTARQFDQDLTPLLNTQPERTLVVDLVGRDKDLSAPEQALQNNGFKLYCSLVRMNRVVAEHYPQQPDVAYAQPDDAPRVDALLHEFFDPLSEQLPLPEQIDQWIEQKRVLVRRIDGHIAGFLVFEITGVTSYLRYWFAHPDYRDQKVGSALLRQFFAESNQTKRQFFWVIESNENALKRYRHYGFREENMFDKVWVRRGVN